ncbi:MAG: IS256 family transposase [Anaerolineae bacterium]|jgi:putative transposase|nr:IS256 family transposase [Anaerolineae bacterium]
MTQKKKTKKEAIEKHLPDPEELARELSKAKSIDDFYGKDGIFARMFSKTIEEMLEAELTEELGYEPYDVEGHNTGNSRNGHYTRKMRTSGGDAKIRVPRDRNGEFTSELLKKNSNEIEEKVIAMYAKGTSTRDIQDMLHELYGINVSPDTVSKITDKVWELVEVWQNRPLDPVYAILYLDAMHIKLKRNGKVENVAVYNVLGISLGGHKEILGHWVGEGGEGANFWLSVITDLQNRGVEDVFIAAVDGLQGFSDAIHAIFPKTEVQRCIIHQIRHSLKYVTWADRKAFTVDLKTVYQAATREEAEANLLKLEENWRSKYGAAVKSWQNNWEELATFFQFRKEIRRLIYTTNTVEGYHRQLRKVIKNKSSFPTPQSVRKLLYLATMDITKKWSAPIRNWPLILNQLAIRYEDRWVL